jgi:hypothetical protein
MAIDSTPLISVQVIAARISAPMLCKSHHDERTSRGSLKKAAITLLILSCGLLHAQTPAVPTSAAPAWAQPGSATHTQIAPPQDFHRLSKNFAQPIGIFDGQSDIGAAVVPGSASFDAATSAYTVNSAGYNIWYNRDEFRFLWKPMTGDVSLAADVSFPDPKGYDDRKAVLIIRQDLDDDSKEILVGLHGAGMVQLAQRPEKNARISDMEMKASGRGRPEGATPDTLVTIPPRRLGIEKHGDSIAMFISLDGEPLHQFGPPMQLHIEGKFYVGIGFCSHIPDKSDAAVLSNVVLVNSAGQVR